MHLSPNILLSKSEKWIKRFELIGLFVSAEVTATAYHVSASVRNHIPLLADMLHSNCQPNKRKYCLCIRRSCYQLSTCAMTALDFNWIWASCCTFHSIQINRIGWTIGTRHPNESIRWIYEYRKELARVIKLHRKLQRTRLYNNRCLPMNISFKTEKVEFWSFCFWGDWNALGQNRSGWLFQICLDSILSITNDHIFCWKHYYY